jgi:hypothetical protein
MSKPGASKPKFRISRIDVFILGLTGFVVFVTVAIISLLQRGQPGTGTSVILAGLAGVIGSCLSPLVDQQIYKTTTGPTETELSRIYTQVLIYVAVGFGIAAAAYVITSALLTCVPVTYASPAGEIRSSSNVLGIIAFGGLVGFFVGRTIQSKALLWGSEKLDSSPAVISALGSFEDQLFGRPLLNYDGYAIASWEKSKPSSKTVGQLYVHMVARKIYEEKNATGSPSPINPTDNNVASTPNKIRVLLQGGRDAEQVPFAISVISGNFNVQPQRLVMAAPSEGESEKLSFTFLEVQSEDTDTETEQSLSKPEPVEPPSNKRNTFPILIDVSQAGRTVQLSEMEISV